MNHIIRKNATLICVVEVYTVYSFFITSLQFRTAAYNSDFIKTLVIIECHLECLTCLLDKI